MTIIAYLLLFIHVLLLAYLAFPFLTVFFAALRKEPKVPPASEETDYACIITAYKQADIAVPLVDSLLKQTHQNYHIYLVADDCDISEISIDDARVTLLRPESPLNSKVRSIKHGINAFQRDHEYIVIFDPDNLAPKEFLSKLNAYTQQGYPAVQGMRVAKNLDTLYACLDATGELYYNHTIRHVPWKLGSSGTIAGSGMAIKTEWFEQYLNLDSMDTQKHKVIVAEDKILQLDLVKKGGKIACAPKAYLYDEKVTSSNQVERQRTRWINSYFQHLPASLGIVWQGIRNLNFNQFFFGMITSNLPIFLLAILSTLFAGVDLLAYFITANPVFLNLFAILATGGVIFILNFFLVLRLGKAPKAIWHSLWGIPLFMLQQVKALLKIKKSNKDFLVTTHNKAVSLEELEGHSSTPPSNTP